METRVIVNARFLTRPFTGIQRYAYNVCRLLSDFQLLSPGPPRPAYTDIDPARVTVLSPWLPSVLWEQFALPAHLQKNEILWSPAGAGPVFSRNHVLTIHDVCLLDHPEWWPVSYRLIYRTLWKRAVKSAAKIVTVSEFSRARIADVLNIDRARIEVTYNGVDPVFRTVDTEVVEQHLSNYDVRQPYILAVSAISERKNFVRLFQAWSRLEAEHPGVSLVVVGPSALRFSRGGKLSSRSKSVIYLGSVDDVTLRSLYAGALVFVYPSLYEGFGLPPIEAMACGAPVVTSRVTSIPEIVGDAAVLVDPYDPDSIAEGLRLVMNDSDLRASLRERGFAQSKRFTFEQTAKETLRVLQDVSKES